MRVWGQRPHDKQAALANLCRPTRWRFLSKAIRFLRALGT
jgi:hypothetical protein